MSSVERSWERIEEWLRVNAPDCYAELPGPASDSDIAYAQRVVGVPFPDDLIASLRRHDGSEGVVVIPPVDAMVTAREIAEVYQAAKSDLAYLCERGGLSPDETAREMNKVPRGGGERTFWHRMCVPFARTDGRSHYFVDQAPGPTCGRIGTYDRDDNSTYLDPSPLYASIAVLLEAVADALESDDKIIEFADDDIWEATVEDGRLWWEEWLVGWPEEASASDAQS
ncbi:SMI1/KNR4 family protein [Streptomyces sp. C36]|uniref:SMI1/KNR4 family protein n=1 Tax=Streptomyces sp. C36 TaxID=3237122 RepID=UPI0034C61B28